MYTQHLYGRQYLMLLNNKTTSGLLILIFDLISLPDVMPYDNVIIGLKTWRLVPRTSPSLRNGSPR